VITHTVKHKDPKTLVTGGMTLCHLAGVVSQKAWTFSGTVVGTWNFTKLHVVYRLVVENWRLGRVVILCMG